MHPFRTIVAAVDFSEGSNEAVLAAIELARPRHGRLHLVHAVPDVFNSPWMVESAGVDLQGVQQRWIEDARDHLERTAADRPLDAGALTTAVVVGHPAAEIVRYAIDQGADVIVLGSHGHGAIRRFMLGSVAERVMRHAPCPVMVVPHEALRATAFDEKAAAAVEA